MLTRRFQQVDVFTHIPYFGNPVAVVIDGQGLDGATMQRFARWTNLSETTFILPPTHSEADYRLRIFTPHTELPFGGHPTLGSCHAWLLSGGVPRHPHHIIQECAQGLISLRLSGAAKSGRLSFAAPELLRHEPPTDQLALVMKALGIQKNQILASQCLNNGPTWLGLLLDDPDTVLSLQPDFFALKGLTSSMGVGVAAAYAAETPAPSLLIGKSNPEALAFQPHRTEMPETVPQLEVRAFAVALGIAEDAVTGSLNASLAQWLIHEKHLPSRYVAAQGAALGRAGRVYIEQDAQGQVWVGGQSVLSIEGSVVL